MRWIDWKASSQHIAGRMLLLALLGGLIVGGAVGGGLVWALSHL